MSDSNTYYMTLIPLAGNGVAIAWWRKTLQGATIGQLHRSWAFSVSIKEVALAGKYCNLIALAALTAKLTIIDSSLMQKAFSTYIATDQPHNVTNILGFLNDTIPVTGLPFGRSLESTISHALNVELQTWSQQTTSFEENYFENCLGTCHLEVPAAGFEIDCDEPNVVEVDYGVSTTLATLLNSNGNESVASTNATAQAYVDANFVAPLFSVSFELAIHSPFFFDPIRDPGNYSYILMSLLSTSAQDVRYPSEQTSTFRRQENTGACCPGIATRQSCKLRPAVISYPLQITNYSTLHTSNGVKLGNIAYADEGNASSAVLEEQDYDITLKQQGGFRVLRYKDLNESEEDSRARLSGLQLGFETYLGGKASMYHGGAVGFVPAITGSTYKYLENAQNVNVSQCGYQFMNPLTRDDSGDSLTVRRSLNQPDHAAQRHEDRRRRPQRWSAVADAGRHKIQRHRGPRDRALQHEHILHDRRRGLDVPLRPLRLAILLGLLAARSQGRALAF